MKVYTYGLRNSVGEILHHLSPLPDDLVFEKGLPMEAVIGTCRPDVPVTVDNIVQNPSFVDFLHWVVGKHVSRSEAVGSAAREVGNGTLPIVDRRGQASSGVTPPENLVGVVRVRGGSVVGYDPSPQYRAFTSAGVPVLDPWIEERFLQELSALAGSRSRRQVQTDRTDATVVFRDANGRELTWAELKYATGEVQWAVIGSEQVDQRAMDLHEEGRRAGALEHYERALQCFARASEIAPAWPYPVYDAAFTYLMLGDVKAAHRAYLQVDRMAPRGFFTSKTSLYSLEQELRGALFPGFCRAFALLDSLDERTQDSLLRQIVERHPTFAPAWKELSMRLQAPDERLNAIERGLAAQPDSETRGMLLINRALVLHERGEVQAAIDILGTVALDPASTIGTEALAKATLGHLVSLSRPEN